MVPPVVRHIHEAVGPQLHAHAHGIVEMIEEVGARVWYLPPYSPDFNPIEQMWSKVKSCLRAHAVGTQKTLLNAIGEALRKVTPDECVNYFQHCGYPAT